MPAFGSRLRALFASLPIQSSLALTTFLFASGAVQAQSSPPPDTRPIRILVGYAPGGPFDALSRIVAQGLSEAIKQNVIVEFKPGASGLIAIDAVKNATPDGQTLLLAPSPFVSTPLMMAKPPYDPVTDFTAIGGVATFATVVITGPNAGINSMQDLINAARADATKVTYGSPGIGGPAHLSGELLQTVTRARMTHVPYKGSSAVLPDLMAGRITFTFQAPAGLKEMVAAQRVKALAVVGTTQRLTELPTVPTMAEAGVTGFEEVGGWAGLIGPAKLPAATVTRLATGLQAGLKTQPTQDRLRAISAMPTATSPAEFQSFIAQDGKRWGAIIKAANITLND